MAKAPYAEPRVRVEVLIPDSIDAQVRLLLLDPVRGQLKYGAYSRLVTELLRRWLREVAERDALLNRHEGGM